jgi:hypothetical protein
VLSPDGKTSLTIDYGDEKEPKEDNPELHLNLFDSIQADVLAERDSPELHLNLFDSITTDVLAEKDSPELHLNLFESIKADVIIAEDEDSSVTLSVFDEVKIKHTKGESCIVNIYDTVLEIKDGEVTLTGKEVKITGGTLHVDGSVSPMPSGPFCALTTCCFTGAPHVGNVVDMGSQGGD